VRLFLFFFQSLQHRSSATGPVLTFNQKTSSLPNLLDNFAHCIEILRVVVLGISLGVENLLIFIDSIRNAKNLTTYLRYAGQTL